MLIMQYCTTLAVFFYLIGNLITLFGIIYKLSPLKKIACWITIIGFILHTVALAFLFDFFSNTNFIISRVYFLQIFSWLIILISFILWWKLKISFLILFSAPLASIFCISSIQLTNIFKPIHNILNGSVFTLHYLSIFTSLALMTMAFGSGLLFLYLQYRLKNKIFLSDFQKNMPPLELIDKINYYTILWGFPLYTLGLICGFTWAQVAWGKLISWDPKEITSIFIWFCYAILFHQRVMLGWTGKKPALLAIFIFIISMASLLIINIFINSHHNFAT